MKQTSTEFVDNLLSSREEQPKPGTKVIGFTLSGCIFDIARGAVREEDVYRIYTGTRAKTSEGMEGVIAAYKKDTWNSIPGATAEQAEAICRRLLAAGKIVQPMTEGKRVHGSSHYWAEIEDATTDADIENILGVMRARYAGVRGEISSDALEQMWKKPRE